MKLRLVVRFSETWQKLIGGLVFFQDGWTAETPGVPAKDQPRAKGGKGIEDMPVAWWKELLIWSVSL